MKADEQACPKCAETIKLAATKCKHCGYELSAAEVSDAKAKQAKQQKSAAIGCGVLGLLGILVAGTCVASSGPSPEETKAAEAKTAEDRIKGFHCLSGWDGSSTKFVEAVKQRLRDPDSFEHDETRITPVDGKGVHSIVMGYRAKNGFGGVNRGVAIGTIRQSDCAATVISTELGQ